MRNTAYIKDIASLEQLRIALAIFCEKSENQLLAIDSKLQSRLDNLKSHKLQFQGLIDSAQNNLRSAINALSSCESNTYEDEDGNAVYPNCDYEREELIECRKRLALAEDNYNSFKKEFRNLEISIAEYQAPKIKYKTLIQFEKEAGMSCLKQLINGAEDYLYVSAPSRNGFPSGAGITETTAIIPVISMAEEEVKAAEILPMRTFSFLDLGEKFFSISNTCKNGFITTVFFENGAEYICSEVKIEKKEAGNFGKIVSFDIPPSLQNEKVGKHFINNMEALCRANDCKLIYGWSNFNNVAFYKGLGYQTRNEVKEAGAEVFKLLESNFLYLQQKAKIEFEKLNNIDFIKGKKLGRREVNPLNVISPEEINEEEFWKQHDSEGVERYIDQVRKYDICREMIKQGMTLDEMKKKDFNTAIAYENFVSKSDTIRLQKSGDKYRVDGGGRHRVAAAQIYYLRTGKIIPIEAEIIEKLS